MGKLIIVILLIAGAAFSAIAGLGLQCFRDVLTRMHHG